MLGLVCCLSALAPGIGAGPPPPLVEFIQPPETTVTTTEGIVQLVWRVTGEEIGTTHFSFELQRATEPTFAQPTTHYQGTENGTFVTGLVRGNMYFRVRAINEAGEAGPWSDPPQRVTTAYPNPPLVATLMVIGAIVFLLTAIVIVRGHRQNRRPFRV